MRTIVLAVICVGRLFLPFCFCYKTDVVICSNLVVHSTTSTVKYSLPERRHVNILIGTWHYSLFSKSNLTKIDFFLCTYYPLEAV
jgi:hypothetical protein